MASATFGRKGAGGGETAPARRPAIFLKATAAEVGEAAADPIARARDAFLAAERSRDRDTDDDEADAGAAPRLPTLAVAGKSLGAAYLLWLLLGGFSAHRFYLNMPLTATAQVCLWYVSLMLLIAGHAIALYSLAAGGLWIFSDAFFMSRLRDAANGKLRRRAELLRPEAI